MSYQETGMWRALAAMRIEPAGAAIGFAAKLARENNWDRQRADAVVGEYRRFLYLAGIAGHPVSPSKSVDKAWHLHLTYSRHYWDVLCGRILGRPFHHEPSLGGAAEDARHRDQYARTLALYRATFGEEPPASIWPSAAPERRLAAGASRLAAAAAATGLLAACTLASAAAEAPEEEEGNALLGFIIIGLFIAGIYFLMRTIMRRARGHRGGSHRGRKRGAAGGAYGGYDSSRDDWDDRDYGRSDSDNSNDGGSSCGGGCGGGGD